MSRYRGKETRHNNRFCDQDGHARQKQRIRPGSVVFSQRQIRSASVGKPAQKKIREAISTTTSDISGNLCPVPQRERDAREDVFISEP
jgi:hypothetical protein